jgi:hypothetical protein
VESAPASGAIAPIYPLCAVTWTENPCSAEDNVSFLTPLFPQGI